MMFTQVKRARLTYAIVMASCTCVIMSAVSTSILRPIDAFWDNWPHVLFIDLCVAIPGARYPHLPNDPNIGYEYPLLQEEYPR